MSRPCKWKEILLWMPEGASVFSSKPLLPVNEGNSTKNQTQSLISRSYSKAIHSSKVGTSREKLGKTLELLKYWYFQRQILNMKISKVLKPSWRLYWVNNTWLFCFLQFAAFYIFFCHFLHSGPNNPNTTSQPAVRQSSTASVLGREGETAWGKRE